MYHEEFIKGYAAKFIQDKATELDTWRVREDLNELYREIAQALHEKGHIGLMPRYRELMQKEQDMYDPYAAYLSGRQNAFSADRSSSFMDYLRSVIESPDNQQALRERDQLFYQMCDILGDDERRLLLTDYNEIYRQYHGIISQHIDMFFDMGYYLTEEVNRGEFPVYLGLVIVISEVAGR